MEWASWGSWVVCRMRASAFYKKIKIVSNDKLLNCPPALGWKSYWGLPVTGAGVCLVWFWVIGSQRGKKCRIVKLKVESEYQTILKQYSWNLRCKRAHMELTQWNSWEGRWGKKNIQNQKKRDWIFFINIYPTLEKTVN